MSNEVGALLGMGLCSLGFLGAAIGVGLVFAKMIEAVGRQPNAEPKLTKFLWIGFAFVEQFGLFSFVIAILLMLKT